MNSLAEICARVATKDELVSLLNGMNDQCNALLAENERLREAIIKAIAHTGHMKLAPDQLHIDLLSSIARILGEALNHESS